MDATKRITRILGPLTLPVLAAVGFGASAAEAPPPPTVMEAYTCSYNAGKDEDDLMSARDYYVRQAEKAGIKLPASFLWTLNRGDVPFDIVWLTPHADMVAFAEASDAESASSDMANVDARFNTVVDCTASLGAIAPVFQRAAPDPDRAGEPAFVGGSACNFRPGMGPDSFRDLRNHLNGVLSTMGDDAPNFAFTVTPITDSPTSPDLFLFSVNDSLTAWAKFYAGVRANEGGPMLGRHFNSVLDCNLALWDSQRVIAPPE